MMDNSVKRTVKLILNYESQKISNTNIAKILIKEGVSSKIALELVECVTKGFQAGINAIVTGGLSSEKYTSGNNPYYDEAFRKGKAAMRLTTPFWILLRVLLPFILGVIIIGIIIWIVCI